MRTGIPLIDAQHDAIHGLIQRIADGEPLSHATILTELAEYALVHFATEEYMLALALYPGLEEHRREHNEFRRRLAIYCTTPEGVVEYLNEWWESHVLGDDASWVEWRGQI